MKLRIPPPLIALFCAFVIWQISQHFPSFSFASQILVLVSYVLIVVGLVIDVGSVLLFFKRKTTVTPLSPDKASTLVVEGFYKLSRNPMYLGMALLLLGWAAYCGNVLGLFGVVFFIWYITKFQIKPEEEILKSKFGDAYLEYSNRVRRWI